MPAGAPMRPQGGWCKENPEKCAKMKELREERHQWCKDNPGKCEKWKERHPEQQN